MAQAAAGQRATYEEHAQARVRSQNLPVGTDLFEKLFARFVDAAEAAAPTLLLATVKRPGFPDSTVSFLGGGGWDAFLWALVLGLGLRTARGVRVEGGARRTHLLTITVAVAIHLVTVGIVLDRV